MTLLNSEDAAGFARLAQELAREPDTAQTVRRVIELAQQSICGCDFAGFTLTHPDRLETVAALRSRDRRTRPSPTRPGEGPCLQAARTEETYLIRDTRVEPRWPAWAGRAATTGIRSVLSVQLAGPSHLHAAMNLYSKIVDAFDQDAVATARIYATHAGNAIAATNEIDQLRAALQSRHTIGVAQGVLMNRYGITEDKSFRFLSRLSQDSNIKLRDIATKVITEAQNTQSDTPGPLSTARDPGAHGDSDPRTQ